VGTIHGKNYFWEKGRRRLAYRLIAKTGKLVAVSHDLRRFIVEKVGIPEPQIEVIYNGVRPTPPIGETEARQCRSELGIQAEDLVIGTIGSLYPVKGHTYLLDAMPIVLRQHPNTMLLIAGRGELEVPLKEQAKRLGIENHVRFLGMRQDIPRLLASMDLFVLPSLSEGLSMALLEAMASARPVVATRVGGNPELVSQGATGLLVPSQNVPALADGVLSLLSSRDRLRQFGETGKERVRRDFTTDRTMAGYRGVYAELGI
jgi:glycosyltransferase involved in cell wall biosynthesis